MEQSVKAKKSMYKETYKKGVWFNDLTDIKKYLTQKDIIVYAISCEKNSDGTEAVTIKIDNIKIN